MRSPTFAGKNRRLGVTYIRICSTAEKLQSNQITGFKWASWLKCLLNEHAPYKRGVVRPEMSFAKILNCTKWLSSMASIKELAFALLQTNICPKTRNKPTAHYIETFCTCCQFFSKLLRCLAVIHAESDLALLYKRLFLRVKREMPFHADLRAFASCCSL